MQFVSFKETEDMFQAEHGNDLAARFHGVKELLGTCLCVNVALMKASISFWGWLMAAVL